MNTTITANPHLTDAECDAILRRLHGDIRLDMWAINSVDLTIYRRSQYPDLVSARDHGATARVDDLFGYTTALDAIDAMARAVDLVDHRASEDDVRVVITVNRTATLPECWLADAQQEIHRHMVRMGWYTLNPNV